MKHNGHVVDQWYHNGVRVFARGRTVTYMVDKGVTYSEEVDYGYSCLNPTTFNPTKNGWIFVGWREDDTVTNNILTSKTMEQTPITLFAVFRKEVTVTYYPDLGFGTAKTMTDSCYYNNGNTTIPSFSLRQSTVLGWKPMGWTTGTAANANITHNDGDVFTADSDLTLYARYSQPVTIKYYNGSSTLNTITELRQASTYNKGVYVNPSFTLSQANKSGWSPRGWSMANAGDADIKYTNGATFTRESNIVLYGCYYKNVTLSYNGNSATSGSVAPDSKFAYWAPAGYINPSFTIKSNGFSKTDYEFNKWALGSISGKQYNAGEIVTLADSATMYALWTATVPVEFVWIQNGVAAPGYTLKLTHNASSNCSTNFDGLTSVAELRTTPNDDNENHRVQVHTNYVNTAGATKMTISFGVCDGGQNQIALNNYGDSSTWAVQNGAYNVSHTFDVAPNTNVRLCMDIGHWAMNGGAVIRITQVRFHN